MEEANLHANIHTVFIDSARNPEIYRTPSNYQQIEQMTGLKSDRFFNVRGLFVEDVVCFLGTRRLYIIEAIDVYKNSVDIRLVDPTPIQVQRDFDYLFDVPPQDLWLVD